MKKINSMITRSMAAVAAIMGVSNPYTTKATEPKGVPLLDSPTYTKVKYNFINMLRKPSATKKYVNGKLRTWQRKFYTKKVRVERGAVGARNLAMGTHWVKAL